MGERTEFVFNLTGISADLAADTRFLISLALEGATYSVERTMPSEIKTVNLLD